MNASNGGEQCDGAIEISETCDLEPCPSKDLISFIFFLVLRNLKNGLFCNAHYNYGITF
jgi:hypothetical protein